MELAAASNTDVTAGPRAAVTIRSPRREDGAAVWQLVADTASLDDNSMYCNLLQCSHFASTCAVAEMDGEIVGWISGYIPPEHPDTYFVWQVCVAEKARGRGLAKRLINAVLARRVCADVRRIQSTITSDNKPSWALFSSVAETLEADLARQAHFKRDTHFAGKHDTEFLVTIGPFEREALPVRSAA
ncbi:diaminobutyrate acetyltransferase [Pelagibacterium sp. 26DY04]|uniref:diaminobutyrate acetyltransferase n=1 Tax=Pelagibacterium sp. 26DY04 TaxID=2967130 RepID=UPI002815CEC6|nr:diaminobutyrate acetyltransferase [Pelagibacterium sp. 26DY04]WMT87288.1 diaminobutyrate acetyltransferase [Pelagibacterium sp. 26DY04]